MRVPVAILALAVALLLAVWAVSPVDEGASPVAQPRAQSAPIASRPPASPVPAAADWSLAASRTFRVAPSGQLILDAAAAERVLVLLDAESGDGGPGSAERAAATGLGPEQAEEARRWVGRFRDYRTAESLLLQEERAMEPQAALAMLDRLARLRRQHFGEALGERLFGAEEERERAGIASLLRAGGPG